MSTHDNSKGAEPVLLSRGFIEAGGIGEIVARDAPALRQLTDAEREASRRALLDTRPPGDVWLFAYGSLIWNPAIDVIERRIARIDGWHRAFCLSTLAGRGTTDNPGLVLGLEEGGTCVGLGFRIAEGDLERELKVVWQREMLAACYVPRWVDVLDDNGSRFGSAIAFTIDPSSEHYAGDLATEAVIQRLATASGALGSSADYLFRTRDGLRALGIPDLDLEQLAARVEAVQAAQPIVACEATDSRF